jgi:hypothetical protein
VNLAIYYFHDLGTLFHVHFEVCWCFFTWPPLQNYGLQFDVASKPTSLSSCFNYNCKPILRHKDYQLVVTITFQCL